MNQASPRHEGHEERDFPRAKSAKNAKFGYKISSLRPLHSLREIFRFRIRDGLNGWNGLNDWNKFISATSAAREPRCRNFCRCAGFHRWRTFGRPAPQDRHGNRRPRRKFRKPSRRTYYRTTESDPALRLDA